MGATISRTAPGTNTLEPREPTGRWRGGSGAPGVRSRLLPPRLWFLHAPPSPLPQSDPSVCGAAALHLFPLLPPPLCFLFSTILTIKGALPTLPCRRGPDQPRFDALLRALAVLLLV